MDIIEYINNAKTDDEIIYLFKNHQDLIMSKEYWVEFDQIGNFIKLLDTKSKYFNYFFGLLHHKKYLVKKYYNLNIKLDNYCYKYLGIIWGQKNYFNKLKFYVKKSFYYMYYNNIKQHDILSISKKAGFIEYIDFKYRLIFKRFIDRYYYFYLYNILQRF